MKPQKPSANDPDVLADKSPSGTAHLPDYDDEKEHPPDWRSRLLNWKTGAVAVVLLGGAVAIWGPDLYREAKVRRALGIIAQGQEAFKSRDMAKASESFRMAFSLAPGDERIVRLIARYNAELGDPRSLQELQKRLEEGSATPEENLVLAQACLLIRNVMLARKALDALPEKLDDELEIRRQTVLAPLLIMEGHLAESLNALRTATSRFPGKNGDPIRLQMGELLLAQKDTIPEGLTLLSAMGDQPSAEGSKALRLLARFQLARGSTAKTPENLADRLRAHPQKIPDDDLLAAELDLAEPGADRPAIIQALMAKTRDGKKSEGLTLARWLIQKGALDQVSALISPEQARQDNEALLVCLDALGGQGLWKEARAMLSDSNAPDLDDAIRHLFLARAASELGETEEAARQSQEVRRYLRLSSPQTMLYVAIYSEKRGQLAEARHAYRLLADRTQTAAEGYLGLIRCLPPGTPAPQALALYDQLLAVRSDLPEAVGDRAYLSLLAGKDLEASSQTALQLHREHPQMLSFLSTAALGALRLGDAESAERLYAGKQIDWKTAPDIWKVVRIAVLRASGNLAAAQDLQSTIRSETLRPEEKELLGL